MLAAALTRLLGSVSTSSLFLQPRGSPHHDRVRLLLQRQPSSLELQLLFRVSLHCSIWPLPTALPILRYARLTTSTKPPSKVSFPSAFTAVRSHRSHVHSHERVPLHPWVFSTLRCFAPQTTFRVYFAPVPLLGFAPRGLTPRPVPSALSGPAPLMTFTRRIFLTRTSPHDSNAPPRLQGLIHLTEHAKAALVIHRHNPRCLRELSLL